MWGDIVSGKRLRTSSIMVMRKLSEENQGNKIMNKLIKVVEDYFII